MEKNIIPKNFLSEKMLNVKKEDRRMSNVVDKHDIPETFEENDESKNFEFPSERQVELMAAEELATLFLKNNKIFLDRVKAIGLSRLPHIALHGTNSVLDFEVMKEHAGEVSIQLVTRVFDAPKDEVEYLTELYDIAGGDAPFFAKKDVTLMVFFENKEKKYTVWGSKGEPKNWDIALKNFELSGFITKVLGGQASDDDLKFFQYFDKIHQRQIKPIAQKSEVYFQNGEDLKKNLLGSVNSSEMPLYLLEQGDYATPAGYNKFLVSYMVFVQWVVNKVLQIIEEQYKMA